MQRQSSIRFLVLSISIALSSSFLARKAQAQQGNLPAPEMCFVALIVSDMEVASEWYQRVLGFELVSSNALPDYGIEQANLSNGTMALELIALESALSPKESIPEYSTKTRLQGLFKIGLQIQNFENWIDHFKEQEVTFHGNIVTDPVSGVQMVIILDPDGNRIQLFEKP